MVVLGVGGLWFFEGCPPTPPPPRPSPPPPRLPRQVPGQPWPHPPHPGRTTPWAHALLPPQAAVQDTNSPSSTPPRSHPRARPSQPPYRDPPPFLPPPPPTAPRTPAAPPPPQSRSMSVPALCREESGRHSAQATPSTWIVCLVLNRRSDGGFIV